MDRITPAQRSRNMSAIRSTDTKAEVRLRKALFARGLRFRKNVRKLPGTPDIVMPKHRMAVQVRGCFWHAHGCKRANTPASNTGYWDGKLKRNVERDAVADSALNDLGWRVRVVWECEIEKDAHLSAVADSISREARKK